MEFLTDRPLFGAQAYFEDTLLKDMVEGSELHVSGLELWRQNQDIYEVAMEERGDGGAKTEGSPPGSKAGINPNASVPDAATDATSVDGAPTSSISHPVEDLHNPSDDSLSQSPPDLCDRVVTPPTIVSPNTPQREHVD